MDAFPGAFHAFAALVIFVGVWAGVRGVKLFVRGFRWADYAALPCSVTCWTSSSASQ